MLQLYKACYMWRKFAKLPQYAILGEKKVKTISAFENGRSSNIKIFEQYYMLAIAMNQKDEFDYFVNYVIETAKKRGEFDKKPEI